MQNDRRPHHPQLRNFPLFQGNPVILHEDVQSSGLSLYRQQSWGTPEIEHKLGSGVGGLRKERLIENEGFVATPLLAPASEPHSSQPQPWHPHLMPIFPPWD
jgi:hypothetical protein